MSDVRGHRTSLGAFGERLAAQYLISIRYKIIDRNFRQPYGELDIVARDPRGILVFVEVKTMTTDGPSELQPEDQMTAAKRIKFARAASLYAGARQELIDDRRGWRMDVIAIVVPKDDSSKHTLRHYENV